MNSSQVDALIADLDRAANLFKQLVSAGLIVGGILAACFLSGCGLVPQRRDWQLSQDEWNALRDYLVAEKLIQGMDSSATASRARANYPTNGR